MSKIRSFVARLQLSDQPAASWWPALVAGDRLSDWIAVGRDPLRIWVRPRERDPRGSREDRPGEAGPYGTWLLGDDAERRGREEAGGFANAATIAISASGRSLTIGTSITGLPPVFLYLDGRQAVLASDLYLIAAVPGVCLELDPAAVAEHARIGHPTSHRTLFKRTTLVRAGARVEVSRQHGVRVERSWQPPEENPVGEIEFLERQIGAFTDAVRRLDVSRSFLSFTAGLDTRTIFAALADEQRSIPAATMTGTRLSLDARTAARVSAAYGVPHTLVVMGPSFTRNLPDYVVRASELSGGLAGLRQAPEVYLYDQLGGRFMARLSGNLGNQVGRGGTEGVGMRRAAIVLLSPEVRAHLGGRNGHWLQDRSQAGLPPVQFSLQQEYPFALAGNYSIGNHFAVQQSPYADRALVETLSSRPRCRSGSASLLRMRLRDLRHRFLGEPASTSFQRRLLKRLGGFAAAYPINYGWRARGGLSASGLLRGAAAVLGMVTETRRLDEGLFGGLVERTGLTSLHTFDRSARWLRRDLREFTCDILSAQAVREAGIFDPPVLARAAADHFTGRSDHFESITFGLEIALALRLFCRSGSHERTQQSA